jgi:protein-tyrosine phosphatase
MDMTWIMDRIAVGGGIECAENMEQVARAGVTHILNMQIEFDDTDLAAAHGIKVLNNGVYNDFEPKPPELFQRGVEFGTAALRKQNTKLLIHCTLGMHRAPTMALALLCSLGWPLAVARQLIERCRPVVYFCDNYISSVEEYLSLREATTHLGARPEENGAVQTA